VVPSGDRPRLVDRTPGIAGPGRRLELRQVSITPIASADAGRLCLRHKIRPRRVGRSPPLLRHRSDRRPRDVLSVVRKRRGCGLKPPPSRGKRACRGAVALAIGLRRGSRSDRRRRAGPAGRPHISGLAGMRSPAPGSRRGRPVRTSRGDPRDGPLWTTRRTPTHGNMRTTGGQEGLRQPRTRLWPERPRQLVRGRRRTPPATGGSRVDSGRWHPASTGSS
jgi:hypothetical protein